MYRLKSLSHRTENFWFNRSDSLAYSFHLTTTRDRLWIDSRYFHVFQFIIMVIVQAMSILSLPKPKIIGYNWPLSSQYIVNLEFLTKRSDMKEIARPEKWKWNIKNSICVAQIQFWHVCSVFLSYSAPWHRHWKFEGLQIEFLKFHFHFSGRAISFISLLLVKNSKFSKYWLKSGQLYPIILGFGKDITIFVNLKYHSNCYLSKHFLRVQGHNSRVTSQISR
jgi:hypothetical protein